ncbi:MAG TPA: hypothetical protein VFJ85_07740 [Acidimicrobiales bacterium]|nr:hypothetical protein [Acidimicrobiales bacterium]
MPTNEPLDEVAVDDAIADEPAAEAAEPDVLVTLVGMREYDEGFWSTPEGLEARLERDDLPADELLHVEDEVSEAVLDEGLPLDDLDADDLEWAIEEEAERAEAEEAQA